MSTAELTNSSQASLNDECDDNDDDVQDTVDPAFSVGVTPVGVTIAYRTHRQLHGGGGESKSEDLNAEMKTAAAAAEVTTTEMPPRRSSASSLRKLASHRRRRRRRSSLIKRKAGKIKKPISSFSIFLEGATLYAACLILPALLGSVWKRLALPHQESGGSSWSESVVTYACRPRVPHPWLVSRTLRPFCDPCEDPVRRHVAVPPTYPLGHHLLWSTNTNTHEDVWTVAWLALGLAVIRLAIMQWIVMPLQSAVQLQAMVRCKSIHLLSADYSQTPTGTPRRLLRQIHTQGQDFSDQNLLSNQHLLPFPSLTSIPDYRDDARGATTTADDDADNTDALGLGIDESERDTVDPIQLRCMATNLGVESKVVEEEEEDEDEDLDDDDVDDDQPGNFATNDHDLNSLSDDDDEVDDELVMQELAERLSVVAAQEIPSRLYAGPRYATALFRLLYTTAASALALYYFHDADFWPWYVGGSGSTRKCWDLSGGLTVSGLDADFDHHNDALKHYFLWQASYHWHSGAFHILSMIILLLHPPDDDDRHYPNAPTTSRAWILRTNSTAYASSLAQHLLVLGSMAVAYVFSSLRRLAAIAMFAFDVSSWFLHLLQVCINAPAASWLARPETTIRLHRYVVIPVFMICRAGIWPALAYSALTESNRWLQQLERTLWPGSAQQLRWLLGIWHILVLASSAVYARRLWNHKHIQRVAQRNVGAYYPQPQSPPSQRQQH